MERVHKVTGKLGPSQLRPPFTGPSILSYKENILSFSPTFSGLQHRAGVGPYTAFYNFAESCVSKNSRHPLLCDIIERALSSFSRVTYAGTRRAMMSDAAVPGARVASRTYAALT